MEMLSQIKGIAPGEQMCVCVCVCVCVCKRKTVKKDLDRMVSSLRTRTVSWSGPAVFPRA